MGGVVVVGVAPDHRLPADRPQAARHRAVIDEGARHNFRVFDDVKIVQRRMITRHRPARAVRNPILLQRRPEECVFVCILCCLLPCRCAWIHTGAADTWHRTSGRKFQTGQQRSRIPPRKRRAGLSTKAARNSGPSSRPALSIYLSIGTPAEAFSQQGQDKRVQRHPFPIGSSCQGGMQRLRNPLPPLSG